MELNLVHNEYYWDNVYNCGLIFEEEENGYYWFYCTDENRHVAYYEEELDNLRRY